MNQIYSQYPQEDFFLYYVEFNKFEGRAERWRLFKRNYIWSNEEFEEVLKGTEGDFAKTLITREGHPWQLANGEVNQREEAEDLNTRKYLKFLVDSLNLMHSFKKEVREKDGARQNTKK